MSILCRLGIHSFVSFQKWYPEDEAQDAWDYCIHCDARRMYRGGLFLTKETDVHKVIP